MILDWNMRKLMEMEMESYIPSARRQSRSGYSDPMHVLAEEASAEIAEEDERRRANVDRA